MTVEYTVNSLCLWRRAVASVLLWLLCRVAAPAANRRRIGVKPARVLEAFTLGRSNVVPAEPQAAPATPAVDRYEQPASSTPPSLGTMLDQQAARYGYSARRRFASPDGDEFVTPDGDVVCQTARTRRHK